VSTVPAVKRTREDVGEGNFGSPRLFKGAVKELLRRY
jgi:hypothetical protein